jgi:hypothetical protein
MAAPPSSDDAGDHEADHDDPEVLIGRDVELLPEVLRQEVP